MDSRNLPKSEKWPNDGDFERVLLYMRVPYSDVNQIISVMRLFEPYLLKIGFDTDMDFLYLLNSITVNIVHTAPDAREERAKSMIRALCKEEALVCYIDLPEEEYIEPTIANQEELPSYSSSRHPDCDPTVCSQELLCDLCQSFDSNASGKADADQPPIGLDEGILIPEEVHQDVQETNLDEQDIQDLCLALERVDIPVQTSIGCAKVAVISPSARRRLRKRKQREFFNNIDAKTQSATSLDRVTRVKNRSPPHLNQSPPNLPFYTFVSNMADLDWLRSRGVSDKIRLLTERLKLVYQS